MANIMYSKHNRHFLLSLAFSGAENADSIVSNQAKNSIENFTIKKGGIKSWGINPHRSSLSPCRER